MSQSPAVRDDHVAPGHAGPEGGPPDSEGAVDRVRPVWVRAAAWAAAVWSLVYGLLGLSWGSGAGGFPFGEGDPEPVLSWFGSATAEVGGPVIAVLGAAGCAVAVALAAGVRRAPFGPGLVAVGVVFAAVLLLVVPDYRVLMAVAYSPVLVVGWSLGLISTDSVASVFAWPVLNQVWCMVGGFLWLLAALAHGRRGAGACDDCGRTGTEPSWTTPESAARWGRRAVLVSVAMPVTYCLTRWAWALGLALGASEEMVAQMPLSVRLAAAMLATMGLGGAVLTFGLVRPWGEVFPRWMVGLAGRRVPVWLAVVPASVVAVLFVNAGLMYLRIFLPRMIEDASEWGTAGPEFLFPLWGVALGAATVAYRLRRRERCRVCGRGGRGAAAG